MTADPHAARAAADEDRLTETQPGVAHEPEVGGDRYQGRGGSLAIGDPVGGRIQPAFIDSGELRAGALPAQEPLVRAPYPHPRLEPIYFGPNRHHLARQITADDKGKPQGHRDRPRPNIGIDRIDRGGPHPHERLPGTGDRIGQFPAFDHVRITGAADERGLHREAPPAD